VEFTYQSVRNHFVTQFNAEPFIVRSPGRINMIGEHTDYNDGFVMPAAIDKEIIFALAPSGTANTIIHALNFQETINVDMNSTQRVQQPAWANYLLGVIRQLTDRGHSLKPFACVFGGNIPAGSGMSSSAALECGFAFALSELNDLQIPKVELAKIGQWSEHNFVGVRCGIMDQFANMMGKENHVIQLDCRSLQFQYFPIQLQGYSIVLFNSGVKHSLASSEYNIRRAECEEGVHIIKSRKKEIFSLRDVSVNDLEANRSFLSENVYNRCKYIVQEIERVQLASADLQRGDLKAFGTKMFETHDGLSNLYKVSCAELDYLVTMAHHHMEVIGSRLMGGGFGGCTINIIQTNAVDRITDMISTGYREQFKIEIEPYRVQIKDGTSLATVY
jgi:galactokinase